MRRIFVTLISFVLLQLVIPVPAHAWWEFIEDLSGPGKFYGFSLDARLICLVDPGDGSTKARVPSALGVMNTSCRVEDKEKRRAAVDLGARFVWAGDNPRFANSRRISLTTLEPSVSFRLIKSDRWDFVDYAFGAGVYWFSSSEFPSFNGVFLDPVRFEFHATSDMRKSWKAVFVPRVRVGMLVFPGGFDTGDFAARSDVQPRISRDRSLNVGLFLDLEPVLKHLEW